MADGEKLIPINIVDEMKSSYIDYSMSVIVSRQRTLQRKLPQKFPYR